MKSLFVAASISVFKATNIRSTVGLIAALALVSMTVGCGNGLADVRGLVTVEGESLTGGDDVRGTIYFYPEGGTGAPAVGILDSEGRYRISTGTKTGVAPGAYAVSISATRIVQSEGGTPSGRPITDRKFADPRQSGLRVEVGPGSNEFDFDVEKVKPVKKRRRR